MESNAPRRGFFETRPTRLHSHLYGISKMPVALIPRRVTVKLSHRNQGFLV